MEYLRCAERIADFVQSNLWDSGTRTLIRSYRVAASNVQGDAARCVSINKFNHAFLPRVDDQLFCRAWLSRSQTACLIALGSQPMQMILRA